MDNDKFNCIQTKYVEQTVNTIIDMLEDKLEKIVTMSYLIENMNSKENLKKDIRWVYYAIMKDIQNILDSYKNLKHVIIYTKIEPFKYTENIINTKNFMSHKDYSKYTIKVKDINICLDLRIKKYIEKDNKKYLGTNKYAKNIIKNNVDSIRSLIYNIKDVDIVIDANKL